MLILLLLVRLDGCLQIAFQLRLSTWFYFSLEKNNHEQSDSSYLFKFFEQQKINTKHHWSFFIQTKSPAIDDKFSLIT
ncbi:hypothetical protein EBM84_11245 [Vibrio parahaemolyticus]|nr:hypothetical protein [Vibrio parahaemolyticus]